MADYHSHKSGSIFRFIIIIIIMSVLKKLEENKPYHGFSKLSIGFHQIVLFRAVKNKYDKKNEDAKTILVELDDQVVFLPQYFREKISDSDIIELNAGINMNEQVFLYFGGKKLDLNG